MTDQQRPCCPIGRRGDVGEIDAALRAGTPYRQVAAELGCPDLASAIYRHRAHIGDEDSSPPSGRIASQPAQAHATVDLKQPEASEAFEAPDPPRQEPIPPLADTDPEADGVLSQARSLKSRAQKLLKQLEDGKQGVDFRGASGLLREIRSCIELQARILGELRASAPTQVNVYTSPDWIRTRDKLLDALAPHPAALEAVIAALQDQQATPADRSLN